MVEATRKNYLVETKAQHELTDPEVLAKAEVAVTWCRHASDYTAAQGGKPWCYLLIPHGEVQESRRLDDFERFACG